MYGLSISFLSEQPTSPHHPTHPGPKLCHEIFPAFSLSESPALGQVHGAVDSVQCVPYCSVRKFSSLWACFYHVTKVTKKETAHYFHLSLPQICSSRPSLTTLCCYSVAKMCGLFATPWTAAHQSSLSFTISGSLLKPVSIELVMPTNHLILCRPLLLPSIFPSIRVFSN